MLTLKVVTTNKEGQVETNLFSGDSFTHKEYFSADHYIVSKAKVKNPITWVIGEIIESSSTQKFIVSEITIYDDERFLKNILFICPKADCYIMDDGRTIDSFFCTYESSDTNTVFTNK
jgi:hypothetical protein